MSINLVTFTTLYPNAVQPRHGVFVEQRLRNLLSSGRVRSRVVAGVPWFPFRHRCFGAYAEHARVPSHEERHGISIVHPRYPVIPKIGMSSAAFLMAQALGPVVACEASQDPPADIIAAHFFYPDGVAAVRIGARLGVPVVITARGTDIHSYPKHAAARRLIQWAAERGGADHGVPGAQG